MAIGPSLMPDPLHAAFPGGPLVDDSGNITPAWRGFFQALYVRTGSAAGASSDTSAMQADLATEAATRGSVDVALSSAIALSARPGRRRTRRGHDAGERGRAEAGLGGGTVSGPVKLNGGLGVLGQRGGDDAAGGDGLQGWNAALASLAVRWLQLWACDGHDDLMRNFCQIATNVDVLPLAIALYRQPELWNQHTARTEGEGSFKATDDIWCRFRDPAELVSREAFETPFSPVFYPAWHALPQLRPIVFALMARCEAVQLGGVMLTRVPPGQQVAPHVDRDRWHASHFNLKIYVPIATNSRVVSTCGDESVVMDIGSAWSFPNSIVHSTVNDGETDRVTLIVCLRAE
jgi:hypothetical protein